MTARRGGDDEAWRRALEPAVAAALARHRAVARSWSPHEWVPWSRGRDFAGHGGVRWVPSDSPFDPAVQDALALNLLTEDNLPSYHHALRERVGDDGPWGEWARRWTAEEARHACALRDYVLLTRALDPDALERERHATLCAGWRAGDRGLLRGLAYAAFQEQATRVAHRNTGRATGDPVAARLMARIATDETLHMAFYRDVVGAALALEPEPVWSAIADELEAFEMPGAETPGYLRRRVRIAAARIYDARIHRDAVVWPLLESWGLQPGEAGCGVIGQVARARVAAHLDHLEGLAVREATRRARRAGASTSTAPIS